MKKEIYYKELTYAIMMAGSPKSAEPMSQSKSKGHQAAIEPGKDGFSWCHQTDDPVQKCQLENSLTLGRIRFFFLPVLLFLFYFIFKLYIIVLVLPNIKMNPPQVYMSSPSWTLLPPHTLPLGRPSAPAPSIQYRVLNLDWQLVSYMIFYMFQCHSPKSSHPLPLPQSP